MLDMGIQIGLMVSNLRLLNLQVKLQYIPQRDPHWDERTPFDLCGIRRVPAVFTWGSSLGVLLSTHCIHNLQIRPFSSCSTHKVHYLLNLHLWPQKKNQGNLHFKTCKSKFLWSDMRQQQQNPSKLSSLHYRSEVEQLKKRNKDLLTRKFNPWQNYYCFLILRGIWLLKHQRGD